MRKLIIARHKLRLLIATAMIMVAVVAWLSVDNRQKISESDTFLTQTDIDFFVKDAKLKSFDLNGMLSNTASSPQIEHFKQTQHSIAQKLSMESYNLEIKESDISADQATILDNQGTVIFQDNVVVTGYKAQRAHNFLKTPSLTYHRNNQSIETQEDVEFTDVFGSIITATGLFSDMNLRTLNLQHNVKGTIHANQ